MKKIVLDKILATVAGGMFIWNAGLGDVVNKYVTASSDSTVKLGCYVPITRSMVTTNGVNFGWLYDHGLVADNNSSASYQEAANADSDGDGLSNAQEYAFGSEPKVSNSVSNIRLDIANKKLSWGSSNSNYTYVVQSRTNLVSGDWQEISTVNYPTNKFDIPTDNKQEFYKIEARYTK
jgi:hypothetical protein